MNKVLSRRPSASMVVAIIALVVAASGTAVAATKLVQGDKLIAKRSLSGNRLRNKAITGTQVNMNRLGIVPAAADAANSGHASIANLATNATNAYSLGGHPASSYLTGANRIGTNGVVSVPGNSSGNTVTLFTVGPFTVEMTCTTAADGRTTATVDTSSTEAGSWINGTLDPNANTAIDTGPDVGPTTNAAINDGNDGTGNAVDLEAPDGTGVQLLAADGVNSLGANCWANWAGIH